MRTAGLYIHSSNCDLLIKFIYLYIICISYADVCGLRVWDVQRATVVKSIPKRHLAAVTKIEFIEKTRFLSVDAAGQVLMFAP